MSEILKLDTVQHYNDLIGHETLHPLVSVVEADNLHPLHHSRKNIGFYVIYLKDIKCADLIKYGRKHYDFQEETLVCVGPGQVIGNEDTGEAFQPKGWWLFFHPDLLRGTPLGRNMKEYSFFSYETDEALHLSKQEREIVIDCMKKIQLEIQNGADKHSNMIITSGLELLLNYCTRFYDRQFITRKKVNKDILERFEKIVDDYFYSDEPQRLGTLSVKYCSDKLCLSANYFGDLIKKETGKSALEYIQNKTMQIAKERISNTNKNINEIAYEMGFQHPQYFSRTFKKLIGCTPNEYRKQR